MAKAAETPRSILAREWRVLKPLLWLGLAGCAILAVALAFRGVTGVARVPKPMQIHAQEALALDDIEFRELPGPPEGADPAFACTQVYEVRLKDPARSFSHDFTLNFSKDTPKDAAVARLDGKQWLRLDGEAAPQTGVSYRVQGRQPGVYALGQFQAAAPATPGEAGVARLREGKPEPVPGLTLRAWEGPRRVGEVVRLSLEGRLPEDLPEDEVRLLWFVGDSEDGVEDAMGREFAWVPSEKGTALIRFVGRTPDGTRLLQGELTLAVSE